MHGHSAGEGETREYKLNEAWSSSQVAAAVAEVRRGATYWETASTPGASETAAARITEAMRANTVLDVGDEMTKETEHPNDDDLRHLCRHIRDGQDGFPADATDRVMQVLRRFRKSIWKGGYLPPLRNYKYDLPHGGDTFREPVIRYRGEMLEVINDQIDKEVKGGLIVEVTPQKAKHLSMVSNVFFKVEKKKMRRCHNYVKANRKARTVNVELPLCRDITSFLRGGYYYHQVDVKSAYNQVEYASLENAEPWAFCIPGRRPGTTRYLIPKRCQFGDQALPSFYTFISGTTFAEVGNCRVYLDDATVKVMTFEEGLNDLIKLFESAEHEGMMLALSKMEIFTPEAKVLGKIVDRNGERPDPERVADILEWALPSTAKQLHTFLGVVGFTQDTSPRYTSEGLRILQRTLRAGKIDPQNRDYVRAFEEVRDATARYILLAPWDPTLPTTIVTDSSKVAMGYYLYQIDPTRKIRRIIALGSKKWPAAAERYAWYDLEATALIVAVRKYANMLRQCPHIILESDCKPAVAMLSTVKMADLPFKFQRHRALLGSFMEVTVKYVGAKGVLVADRLSRQVQYITPRSVKDIEKILTDEEVDTMVAALSFDEPDVSDLLAEGHYEGVREAQRADKEIAELLDAAVANGGQVLRNGYEYVVDAGGCLCRRWEDVFSTAEQLVLPKQWRLGALKEAHDLAGHQGRDSTFSRLLRRYYWPKMWEDCRTYVQSCDPCQRSKATSKSSRKPFKQRQVSELFENMSMDLIEMSTPSQGYNYILVCQDAFSSFVTLIPTKTKSAEEVAAALWERVICVFGPPHWITTDQGKEFRNQLVKRITDRLQIGQEFTFAHHAQGNAKNESSHRRIMQTVRILAERDRTRWSETIPSIQLAVNTAPLGGQSISAYDIVFGQKPRGLDNFPVTRPTTDHDWDALTQQTRDLRDELRALRENRTLEKRIEFETRRLMEPTFQIGDKVLVVYEKDNVRLNKHAMRAFGPYTVVGQYENDNGYKLRHCRTGQMVSAAAHHVYRYYERAAADIERLAGGESVQTTKSRDKPGDTTTSRDNPVDTIESGDTTTQRAGGGPLEGGGGGHAAQIGREPVGQLPHRRKNAPRRECPDCERRFNHEHTWANHVRTVHPDTWAALTDGSRGATTADGTSVAHRSGTHARPVHPGEWATPQDEGRVEAAMDTDAGAGAGHPSGRDAQGGEGPGATGPTASEPQTPNCNGQEEQIRNQDGSSAATVPPVGSAEPGALEPRRESDLASMTPVEGEMVVAAVNDERSKWIVGEVVAPTNDVSSYRVQRYGPLNPEQPPGKWRWGPIYRNELTGALRARRAGVKTRRDTEVVYDVLPEHVVYVFRELDTAEAIPIESIALLTETLPRGTTLRGALDW